MRTPNFDTDNLQGVNSLALGTSASGFCKVFRNIAVKILKLKVKKNEAVRSKKICQVCSISR